MVFFLVALVGVWAGFILGIFCEESVNDDLLIALMVGLYCVTAATFGYLVVRGVMVVVNGV